MTPGRRPRLILVEDEYLIALDTVMMLEDLGYEVAETCDTVARALSALDELRPDAALLDVNLKREETSFPVAEVLSERGVPFVFLTGYTPATRRFPSDFDGVMRVQKPTTRHALEGALQALFGGEEKKGPDK